MKKSGVFGLLVVALDVVLLFGAWWYFSYNQSHKSQPPKASVSHRESRDEKMIHDMKRHPFDGAPAPTFTQPDEITFQTHNFLFSGANITVISQNGAALHFDMPAVFTAHGGSNVTLKVPHELNLRGRYRIVIAFKNGTKNVFVFHQIWPYGDSDGSTPTFDLFVPEALGGGTRGIRPVIQLFGVETSWPTTFRPYPDPTFRTNGDIQRLSQKRGVPFFICHYASFLL